MNSKYHDTGIDELPMLPREKMDEQLEKLAKESEKQPRRNFLTRIAILLGLGTIPSCSRPTCYTPAHEPFKEPPAPKETQKP